MVETAVSTPPRAVVEFKFEQPAFDVGVHERRSTAGAKADTFAQVLVAGEDGASLGPGAQILHLSSRMESESLSGHPVLPVERASGP